MKILISEYDNTVTAEIPDGSDTHEVLTTVRGLMIALTYYDKSILEGMKEILEDENYIQSC